MKGKVYFAPNRDKKGKSTNPTLDRWNLKEIRRTTENKEEYTKCKKWYRLHGFVYVHDDGIFIEDVNLMVCGKYDHVDDGKCLRCGECCRLSNPDGSLSDVFCGCLQKEADTGQNYCVMYEFRERIGHRVDKEGAMPPDLKTPDDNICIPRVWQSIKIAGCPYNDELRGWF